MQIFFKKKQNQLLLSHLSKCKYYPVLDKKDQWSWWQLDSA